MKFLIDFDNPESLERFRDWLGTRRIADFPDPPTARIAYWLYHQLTNGEEEEEDGSYK